MSATQQGHIDDATWKTMQAIKDRRDRDTVELACHQWREDLIQLAAAEGLTPAEIDRARWLETTHHQNFDEAADRCEQSQD